jgi:hypothetical protein
MCLTFRDSRKDNLSELKDVLINSKNGKILDYAENLSDIYNKQDFCLFFGYKEESEIGKIEYSMLEAIWYEIPILMSSKWMKRFMYKEYGVDENFAEKSFLKLDYKNIKEILNKKNDFSSYANNAKHLIKEFLPEAILERIEKCINSF